MALTEFLTTPGRNIELRIPYKNSFPNILISSDAGEEKASEWSYPSQMSPNYSKKKEE